MTIVVHKVTFDERELYLPQITDGGATPASYLCANITKKLHAFTSEEKAIAFAYNNGVSAGAIYHDPVDIKEVWLFVEGRNLISPKEIENFDLLRCILIDYFIDTERTLWNDDDVHDDLIEVFVRPKLFGWSGDMGALLERLNKQAVREHFRKLVELFENLLVVDEFECVRNIYD